MKNFLNALASATGSTLSAATAGGSGGKRQRGQRKTDRGETDRRSQVQFIRFRVSRYEIFAVVVSVAPLLSTQLTFSSSPFLPPLKANLT